MELKLKSRSYGSEKKSLQNMLSGPCKTVTGEPIDMESYLLSNVSHINFDVVNDYDGEFVGDPNRLALKIDMLYFWPENGFVRNTEAEDSDKSIYLDKHGAAAIRDFMQNFINQVEEQEGK